MSDRAWMAVVALAFAWMQAGPLFDQVLRWGREPLFTKGWEMYSTRGANVCGVAWFVRGADGALTPVDHVGELYGSLEEAHGNHRWQRNKAMIRTEAKALCRKLGEDVRVDAWCGVPPQRGAWTRVLDPEEPQCSR